MDCDEMRRRFTENLGIVIKSKCDDNKSFLNSAKSKVVYYVTNGELFEIIHNAHLAIGYGGRNRWSE